LGANPAESNGSVCTAPDFMGRVRRIQERGGKVVNEHRRSRPAIDGAARRARAGRLEGGELEGAPLTVSNLGGIGGLRSRR
jgi:hypothetical protein